MERERMQMKPSRWIARVGLGSAIVLFLLCAAMLFAGSRPTRANPDNRSAMHR
jgi:hypothetical protein